jgi:hypothetical protein
MGCVGGPIVLLTAKWAGVPLLHLHLAVGKGIPGAEVTLLADGLLPGVGSIPQPEIELEGFGITG